MAKTIAVAGGPIELMDPTVGRFVCLPLSDIFFDNGQVKAKGAIYEAFQGSFDALLNQLVGNGYLRPGPPALTRPVMIVQARHPGSTGNTIEIVFKDFEDPDSETSSFHASVVEQNVYRSLTATTVQATLGSTAVNGKRPGLVFIPGDVSDDVLPKAGIYKLAVASGASTAKVEIPRHEGTGVAFVCQARDSGADGAFTQVEIKELEPTEKTFTLAARWEKSTAAKIVAADLEDTFGYLLRILPPEGATEIVAPQPGSVTLGGGQDATAPRASSVVLQR